MENKDWFKTNRKIFDSDIWRHPLQFRLWTWIYGKAVYSYEGLKYGDVSVKRGQYLRSYRKLSEDIEYIENNKIITPSISTIKRLLDQFVKQGRIKKNDTPHGTLITIINYEKYQSKENTLYEDDGGLGTVTERQRNNNKKEKKERNNYNNNGIFTSENSTNVLSNKRYEKETKQIFNLYHQRYKLQFNKEHPYLKIQQRQKALNVIEAFKNEWSLGLPEWETIIDKYFEKNLECDFNINHFVNEGILYNLIMENCYYRE